MTVRPAVFWQGNDLTGRTAKVINTDSYILVEIDDIPGEIKLFRSEIMEYNLDEDCFEEIFLTGIW